MEHLSLAFRPKQLFRVLQESPVELSWPPALLGYGLLAFLELCTKTVERYPEWSPIAVVGRATLGAVVLGWFVQLLFVGGLWLHVGSKIVGGSGSFTATTKAVGYAIVLPGFVALPGALLAITTADANDGLDLALFLIGSIWQVGFGLWGCVRMVRAAKVVHGLSVLKAVVVALWIPVLLTAGLVIMIIVMFVAA